MNGEPIDPIAEVRSKIEDIYEDLNVIDINISNSSRKRRPLNAKKLGEMADDLIASATELSELFYKMETEDE